MGLAPVLWWMGFDGPLTTLAAPAVSVVFIALTSVVLIADLERPERFYYILTRSNWRSWMVWGAYFLTAHGALSALWLGAGWFGWARALDALAVPVLVTSVLATSYTGFLFAQGLARDLWQGPTAAVDLVTQSAAAGAASLLIAALVTGGRDVDAIPALSRILTIALGAHLTILVFEHLLAPSPTRHHELAVETIRRGAYAPLFWGGAIAAGGLLPLVMLAVSGTSVAAVTLAAALLTIAGGAAWEYIWVEAGQSVPLS
jgi:formate-dependent nitrite reductase membrane component NrfD